MNVGTFGSQQMVKIEDIVENTWYLEALSRDS